MLDIIPEVTRRPSEDFRILSPVAADQPPSTPAGVSPSASHRFKVTGLLRDRQTPRYPVRWSLQPVSMCPRRNSACA